MMKRQSLILSLLSLALLAVPLAGQADSETVFELRTYTTHEGKLPELHARFVNHTRQFFSKHGMRNVGYWVPTDPEKSDNTLIYIVTHESREAAEKNWRSFGEDPQWQKAYAQSIEDGNLVKSIDSVFMSPTEYSDIQ